MATVTATVKGTPRASVNESSRRSLLGVSSTGKASKLPFNSGVHPAGHSPSYAGYEGLNDQIEGFRSAPFDVRAGFQYQNRNISEGSTAWNDLKGMQLLDWFDPAFPTVLGMKPFPTGGSYTDAAAGTYDSQLVAIGQTIASKRPAGSTAKVGLRLAWEMNGDWYDHSAFNAGFGSMRADYIAGSQRIITKIREGAGDRVFFIQCWSASTNTRYQSTYWGDAYADVIGIDVYDAFAGTTNGIHSNANLLATGLGGMFDYAKARGKLVSIDEWGGHNTSGEASNGNDNPDFPGVFYDWVNANRDQILYEAQFNDTATGNVENNLWATGGTSVQLPQQRAAYIAKVQSLVTA